MLPKDRKRDPIAAVNHFQSVIPEHQGGSLGGVSHFIDFNSINTLWLAGLADSPRPVPCARLFSQWIWLRFLIGWQQAGKRGARRRPKIQLVGCMFETTDQNMIRVGCQLSYMYEITSVCEREKERERERVCVYMRQGHPLLYWHLMHADPLHSQQSTDAYEWM